MSIGQNIKTLRERRGLSQVELASILGVSDKAVSTWENNIKVPRMGSIQKMADYFQVSKSAIIEESYNLTSSLHFPQNMYEVAPEYVMVPKFGSVSAGFGCLADNEILDYEPWSASSIRKGHDYMCLTVQGDSMYPILIDGDLVLIRCQNSVDSGAIAVVTVNGDEGVIKKVVYGKTWIELHSINPMYQTRRFDGEDVLLIKVMGLVVESKRKFL